MAPNTLSFSMLSAAFSATANSPTSTSRSTSCMSFWLSKARSAKMNCCASISAAKASSTWPKASSSAPRLRAFFTTAAAKSVPASRVSSRWVASCCTLPAMSSASAATSATATGPMIARRVAISGWAASGRASSTAAARVSGRCASTTVTACGCSSASRAANCTGFSQSSMAKGRGATGGPKVSITRSARGLPSAWFSICRTCRP